MLLRHTPKEITERSALAINPAKTCQPVGAMYASLGVHGCLPHSHGSQGCCAYHRSMLTRHYKEPVVAGTSSFTEGSSVFGGQANLLQAINTMFTVYDPDVIAVHTTCLSETIGDDVPQIFEKAKADGLVPDGKKLINAPTPSYVGSHVTGYSNMCKGIVKGLAKSTGKKNGRVNIVPGFVEPCDYAEIKQIAKDMGVDAVVCPDTSGVLNTPLTGKYKMYPKGGTKVEDIQSMGDAIGSLALGEWGGMAAVNYIDATHKVPAQVLDLPIGLKATDRFIDALRKLAGVSVPDSISEVRGQVVDVISDYSQYLYGKKVALAGDPDQVIALAEFCVTCGMHPIHVVTGTPGKKFEERIREITAPLNRAINVKVPGDLFLLHQWILNEPVDLMIGNTYMKYMSRDMNIPLVRHGFPIVDRVGHQYFSTMGYTGALRLLERIINIFLDKRDAESPETSFELAL